MLRVTTLTVIRVRLQFLCIRTFARMVDGLFSWGTTTNMSSWSRRPLCFAPVPLTSTAILVYTCMYILCIDLYVIYTINRKDWEFVDCCYYLNWCRGFYCRCFTFSLSLFHVFSIAYFEMCAKYCTMNRLCNSWKQRIDNLFFNNNNF